MKNTTTAWGRILGTAFLVSAGLVHGEINLALDRDLLDTNNQPVIPEIPLAGDVQYQLVNGEVNLQSKHPVICNRIESYSPNASPKVRITDPNGDNLGDFFENPMELGLASNLNYSTGTSVLSMTSENRSKALCVTSVEFDVIFKTKLEPAPIEVSDLELAIVSPQLDGYSPGEVLDYTITYQNNTGFTDQVDLLEYKPLNPSIPVHFDGVGNQTCAVLDNLDQFIRSCFIDDGVVRGEMLQNGEKIRLTLGRRLSDNSQIDTDLHLFAAVFRKVNTIDGNGGQTRMTSQSFAGFVTKEMLLTVVADQ